MSLPPRPPQTPPSSGAGGSGSLGRPAQRRLWLTREHEETRGGADSFDALTDLFLGEVSRPRREAGDRGDEAVAARPLPGATGPKLRLILADGIDDELGGSTTDAVETDETETPSPEERPPAFIECLVVGNLPVLASAWASQYVREVAGAADRPVAYLRVQAGYASLEIVGESNLNGHALPLPAGDLDGAVRAAAGVTNRWVIRVDQSDESVTAARASMRLVTLLTGADEAARVHAYGALKDLAERLPKAAEPGPAVRVAVMSAPDSQAEETGRKLVDTVRQFLGRDVQHAVCSARIKAGRPAQMVFNGRIELPTALIVEKLEHALEVPAERTAALVGVTATPPAAPPSLAATPSVIEPKAEPSPVAVATQIETVEASSRPDIAPPVEPAPVAVDAAALSATAAVPAAPAVGERRVDDVALWSAAAVEPKSEPASALADLASFVAGLKGTEIRCPYAASVEMGVDDTGRLHLMARSSGPAEDDRVIASLMVASAWADSHAMLLKPALPAFSPAAGAAMLHLFTGTPKTSRRLAETNLRLHLLAPVSVGGQTGWFSTELN